MTVTKKTKASKYRGSKTHGSGSMKKRRGAGNRGGRGNAGTGKRGNANTPSIWKSGEHLGKSYFKKKGRVIGRESISIHNLEIIIPKLIKNGKVKEEDNFILINLSELGYDKLLANGTVTKKYKIIVEQISIKAQEKIKEKGGEIILKDAIGDHK